MNKIKELYYVLKRDDSVCNVVKTEGILFYSWFSNKKEWIEIPELIRIIMDKI